MSENRRKLSGIHRLKFDYHDVFLTPGSDPEKSNMEVYGMQFWISLIKTTTTVLVFYVYSFWSKPDQQEFSMPETPVFDGRSSGNL